MPRLLFMFAFTLLAACSHKPATVTLQHDQQSKCPLDLYVGQQFILTLPSNPTTGFRWKMLDAGAPVLEKLGPEVYTNPEDTGLVGSGGISTWRFRVANEGKAELKLAYSQPWEPNVAPAQSFNCKLAAH
ncbi:protease inhibitor I42 family protein [Ectopseudomonas mendocina]|uniref:Protease inhibitor I42 family protein n=1 Tax=Ectopseudomonas mendocina TaxID=300 RepID=A0ABZ2RCM2_ECTME